MLEGDAEYRWNGVVLDAPEGSMVLCRPPAEDAFRWDIRRRTRHAYFHFRLTGDIPAEWPALTQWALVRPASEADDLLRPLFRHLLTGNRRGDPSLMQHLALSLLAAFVTGETTAAETSGATLPDPVIRVLAHIQTRLDDAPNVRLPLSELADIACVTPEHLCRLFKKATNRTPAETVRLARLDRARALLVRTNYSVAEIAHLSGFDSPFHFSRAFSAAFGRSPRALRQAVADGEHTPMTPLLR